MDIEKLKKLIDDETVDSLDYNLKNNYNIAKPLILGQWKVIYEALTIEDNE